MNALDAFCTNGSSPPRGSAPHLGNAVAIEHRVLADIVRAALDDGLEVE